MRNAIENMNSRMNQAEEIDQVIRQEPWNYIVRGEQKKRQN